MDEERNGPRGALGPLSVAVVGLDTIGGAIARHLLDSDAAITVCDMHSEAADDFVARGARRAASYADAGRGVDVVIEAVGDDAQVLAVVTGPDGVLSTLRPGAVLVLHSTVRLSTARRVAAAAAERGVHVLDAGGSTSDGDETGKLAALVGGEAEDLDLVRPVLSLYTRCVDNLGSLGSEIPHRLIRNLLGYLFRAAGYESLALAEAVGVDLKAFRRSIEESEAASQPQLVLQLPTSDALDESEPAAATVDDDTIVLLDAADLRVGLARDARRLARQFLLLPPEARSGHA